MGGADVMRRILSGLLLALCANPLPAQSGPPPPPVEDQVGDIVVRARRGPRPPLLEPVAYLQRLCFDPVRTNRRFAPPDRDHSWVPLEDDARAQFHVTDPDVPAFGLTDPASDRTLLLKFETLRLPEHLVEQRCTLVVVGSRDPAMLTDRINALVGGPGTQRHVGHPDGVPVRPNWSQWLWNGYPDRGSKRWMVVTAPGAGYAAGTWVVVTDPSFWRTSDYFAIDLKTRERGPRPLSVLMFSFVTKR